MDWIKPMLAAFLHMIASAVVIFNSARLVRFGEHLEGGPLRPVGGRPTTAPTAPASAPTAAALPT